MKVLSIEIKSRIPITMRSKAPIIPTVPDCALAMKLSIRLIKSSLSAGPAVG